MQEDRIVALMKSSDSRAVKNGIQRAYEDLRARPNADANYVRALRRELSRHLEHHDPTVASWIYGLIAVLGDSQYEPYLRAQLADHEFDPVNRGWAVASLARISTDYRRVLSSINDDHSLPYQLAAGLYQGRFRNARTVRQAGDTDDRLTHIWVTLLFSEQVAHIPLELIRDLTESPDAEVSQNALFALHKHPGTGIEAVAIGPQDLGDRQPRVRRWYYQLLAKDPANLDRYAHQLRSWMATESDTQAREGLAKAFVGLRLPRPWIHDLRAWAESETDPYVLDALMQIKSVTDLAKAAARQIQPATTAPEVHKPVGTHIHISNSVVTVVVKKAKVLEVNDQRVVISGNNNTIGAIQGSGSTATVHQVIGSTEPAPERSSELEQLIARILQLLHKQGDPDNQDPEIEQRGLLAADISRDAVAQVLDAADEAARRGRLAARLKQAGLLLSGVATATGDVDQLVNRAIELIHLI
jgi:hypothetical protein